MKPTLLAALLAAATGTAGDVVPPVRTAALAFPARVEMVNLNVSVTTGRDRFVTNLASSDFIVLEDGIRQETAMFVQESLPLSVVLMLDVSGSMQPNLDTVRSAAARLIDKLRPEDEAEIVEFSDRPTVLQSLTSDRAKLMAAVQATETGGGTALHNALYVTLKDFAAQGKSEELRRRAIVLLSDGEDTSSMISDDRVLEAARTCDVAIYSILLGSAQVVATSQGDQARYLLSALARESGGQAFFPAATSELGRLYGRIAQELRSQYNIGYVSSNPTVDGTWRQILVMTPRHDGVAVRHRLGYYAAGAAMSRTKTSDAGAAYRYRAAAAAGQR